MSSSLLSLLTSLPFSHPSFLPLLQSHKPFSNPSDLSQSSLAKLLNRLNSTILSRDDNPDKRASCDIAKEIIEMDEEGYVMTNYGKGWMGTCLGYIASSSSSLTNSPSYINLMTALVVSSSQYPSFEREVIHPIMGKLSVSLGKLFERSVSESRPEWDIILDLLSILRILIVHSPAPFRPLLPKLKPSLYALILQIPTPTNPYPSIPYEIRRSASNLVATLHVTAGKAQSPQSWGIEIREAIGGFGRAMSGITADAWEEEPIKAQPPNASSGLPELPADPLSRLPVCLDWAEGFTEVLLALLRYPTARPVPVPIAQITVPYISPQHHAALLASLPRIWTVGVQLIGSVAVACGDHLFPHLGSILDHSVWLTERVPSSMADTQIQLLKFHQLLLTLFPSALASPEYPTRLLRICLTRVQPLLANKTKADTSSGNIGGGKRGKKRARGAEDGLVGGLEGRESRSLKAIDVEVVVQALRLVPHLHPTPLLSPSLLTFSIRLHLSLYLSLPSLGGTLPSSAAQAECRESIHKVLEKAVLMTEGESGTGRGWKSLIISVLDQHNEKLAPILHPSLPPLMRPLPPLSQLHFFVKEGEEERKGRLGMGFGVVDEVEDGDEVSENMVAEKSIQKPSDLQITPTPNPTLNKLVQSTTTTITNNATTSEASAQTQSISSVETAIKANPAIPAGEIPAPAARSTTVPASVSLAEENVAVPSLPVVSDFISQPSASANSIAVVVENTKDTEDVIMLNDDDEEGIPELDSGSDDFDEDEDEDDED
ncbi:uncharacterized protein L201_001898 [Kwoniella dendrophila CBS 6074]|uniref:Pre-rRNA-processing protein RIX1 n=1 Tax=Kwoniella dendrophila CBS 6074 TaxID=1295534 RepID=A0AAX4JR32_9TREE